MIIGYSKITKSENSASFTVNIMPFGSDAPVENVYLMAVLDRNGNGSPDEGDIMGFYADSDGIPERLTIVEGSNTGFNLDLTMDIPIPSGHTISLEGHPAIPDGYTGESPPLYIMVAETDNPGNLLNNAASTIKAFQKLDAGSIDFRLDLSGTALKPGDEVMVIGLWDKDNDGGFPKPTEGDILGFYHTPDLSDFSMTVTLQDGVNVVIPDESHHFSIDRTLYEYNASVAGTLSGAASGNAILIAYAGEISSMNAGDLDVNKIIGYQEFTIPEENAPYSLEIMPLGFDLPVENVYVMALLDSNGNGLPDGGDRMGFHAGSDGIPERISVSEGETSGIDITLSTDIPVPSGHTITIDGNIEAPAGYNTSSPLYVMVTSASDPAALFDNPADYIISFQKLEPGTTNFSIDLSSTALAPGEEVMVLALWDKDNTGGFPKPTAGDEIGFYHTTTLDDYKMEVLLTEGTNTVSVENNWVFPVNRTLYDFEASITGSINDDAAGEIILIAYAGNISSMDMGTLDVDNVIAYSSVTKAPGPQSYSLSVMAVGHNVPIEPVYVMALHDVNANGIPDGGDRLGYYTSGGDVPAPLTINDGVKPGIDITFSTNIDTPSGYTISVEGSVNPPDGYSAASPPLYIMIADADSPEDLLEDPTAYIRSFQKLQAGASNFSMDLSSTSLAPGDNVMVIALWDKDSTGGFPDPTPGDVIGFYHTKSLENYNMTVTLIEGVNTVIPDETHSFSVDKIMYDYDASVSGNLTDNEASSVILIAYSGELPSLDAASLDIDRVIAYHTVEKGSGEQAYTLNIMPLSFDVPVDDVYIIALYDRNDNGLPDAGDGMGYYSSSANGIPSAVTIDAGELTGIDLSLSRDIETPSGYTMSVSGSVDRPDGYGTSSPPLYIMIATGTDPAALFENPASSVRAFQKLDAGATGFNIDLSSTSIAPGDEVMVIALWDKDNTGGFPEPTYGDMVGFYHTISISSFEMTLILVEGENTVSSDGTWLFSANHLLYDYNSKIQGTLSGTGSGEVILIAYPEEITSMNVADIDVEKIIGYGSVTKTAGDTAYSLDILPFDYSVPIGGVYVMALLDTNANGIPDGGDKMGYYSSNTAGIPTRITVPDGITENIDINLSMDIPVPSGFSMTIEGAINRPAGYDTASPHVYNCRKNR